MTGTIVCVRCGRNLRGEEAHQRKLDLSLTFDHPEANRLIPLRQRESLELCPECREAFVNWLGHRGEAIPGLRTPASATR